MQTLRSARPPELIPNDEPGIVALAQATDGLANLTREITEVTEVRDVPGVLEAHERRIEVAGVTMNNPESEHKTPSVTELLVHDNQSRQGRRHVTATEAATKGTAGTAAFGAHASPPFEFSDHDSAGEALAGVRM